MSEFSKLRLLILMVHLAGIMGLIAHWNPAWLVLTLISVVLFTWLGQEAYCHRYLAHRSFELDRVWQNTFAFLSIFNLFGSPIGIAATHVNHHRYSDSPFDPHPASAGWQTWLWLTHGFEQSRNVGTVKRLMQDEWLIFIQRHYFRIYFSVVGAASLIDIRIATYGFFIPVIYAFFCNGVVNVICHRYGYKLFQTNDDSKNNIFASLILLGNGVAFHNTHHAYPSDYRLSRRWFEIDVVASLIDLFRKKDRPN
jgi:stearoyl-CoA desaturase (delta-9 desaturase)